MPGCPKNCVNEGTVGWTLLPRRFGGFQHARRPDPRQWCPVRYGVSVTLLVSVLLVSGCSDDEPEPAPPSAAPSETPAPAYDATLEPSAAVLALVPDDAETLTVTDFDRVRAELGMDGLTGQSTPEEVAAFWQRAAAERPLLSPGMLRPADRQLATTYGFTQLDVAWEAHFYGAGDEEVGWVLRFRDGTDMAKVTAATEEPAGPLTGGDVDDAEHLVSSGTAGDPTRSWAVDPGTQELVGCRRTRRTSPARACRQTRRPTRPATWTTWGRTRSSSRAAW